MKIFILGSLFLYVGCGNPINQLKKSIQNYGYILYPTPLEVAGTGTMIGGSPRSLSIIAHPQTCFPDFIDGIATNIRKTDRADLPTRYRSLSVNTKVGVDLLNFLSMGNATFRVGAGFNQVKTLELTFEGAKVEYLDSVLLHQFYEESMPQICKDYLQHVGFIIQALRVDKMLFRFKNKHGGLLEVNTSNIRQILDINAGVSYSFEDNVTLSITTPKYIGYQLGRMRLTDNGMSLFRASKVENNNYIFESLDIFGEEKMMKMSPLMDFEADESDFKELKNRDLLDHHSLY